ncbi:MAG: 50S ribosomal protein L2 [Candidatus Blackburnbacteria bacterium RIFCSPLOWO2_01_FULL_41_27]|uniref:Large ribosomal subunit protein uL2 n=2 Tax=Candidatus Blackburniibacteriota TaxID=1817898 RepID=A0A1G1V9G4_9BACT|nr:MAG: 50S ribosomal protein L2 [Candidatus Blackburnbacteria bacterium RIFCSPHIGHO2_12_FULL_41_13b]OGY14826.1 MAG: 50S ribosomal protein L2 [Candidatus Blackburnbacteria bacterium RIFCSPLOWO2_01_FULL_41_27]
MNGLMQILPNKSGRGVGGKIAVRHQGGRHKRFLREIDFVRSDKKVAARVASIEYDPNRTANIALLFYLDGEKRYILAPEGLKVDDRVEAGATVPIKIGNALPLEQIPVGTSIHNIEIRPGMGGQIVRGAGSFAVVQGKDETAVLVKLPSGEIRRFRKDAFATIGQVGRVPKINLRTAGASRRRGIRPTVRGVAMHPAAHPHGGGEGRSPEGMPPKTPWGKPARGVKTRKRKKYSNHLIVSRKKIGYGSKI